MMVNQTTNQIMPGMVVRHVEPIRDMKITLRDIGGTVEDVRSLTDGRVDWEAREGACRVTISELREYEAIVVRVT